MTTPPDLARLRDPAIADYRRLERELNGALAIDWNGALTWSANPAEFLVRRAGLRVHAGACTGAVTLIQRFGSALNLNPHLHMLFLDGAYTFDDEASRFHRVAAPTQAELQRLLHAIATRTTRAVEKQGLPSRDDDSPALDIEPADDFEQLLGAAVHYRIATTVGYVAARCASSRASKRPLKCRSLRELALEVPLATRARP